MGPWGAKDAPLREMEAKSQRLESVTIYFNSVVSAIQFSYIGEDGQICNSGLWGITGCTNSPSTIETVSWLQNFPQIILAITSMPIDNIFALFIVLLTD